MRLKRGFSGIQNPLDNKVYFAGPSLEILRWGTLI